MRSLHSKRQNATEEREKLLCAKSSHWEEEKKKNREEMKAPFSLSLPTTLFYLAAAAAAAAARRIPSGMRRKKREREREKPPKVVWCFLGVVARTNEKEKKGRPRGERVLVKFYSAAKHICRMGIRVYGPQKIKLISLMIQCFYFNLVCKTLEQNTEAKCSVIAFPRSDERWESFSSTVDTPLGRGRKTLLSEFPVVCAVVVTQSKPLNPAAIVA